MSSTTGSKQPKKKRRVDGNEEPAPGPSTSSDVLPLVAPHLVRKSSKDPNRGMYPYTRNKSKVDHSLVSPFVKASELIKEFSDKKYDQKPKIQGLREASTSATVSTDLKSDNFLETKKKSIHKFQDHKKKHSQRDALSHSRNKITKYFKTSPCKFPKVKHAKTSNANSKPAMSGWATKDGEIAKCLANNERFFKTYGTCYGLLENRTKENSEDFLNKLPLHIVEIIFCQIPILDLMACRLVCIKWKEIIDNELFMKWKKLYYKFKKESAGISDIVQFEILSILRPLGHKNADSCIVTLIKCMSEIFYCYPSSDMYALLMKTPKGSIADQVLTERFPELNAKEARVWCQFTIAILMCETVWDVYGVYLSLFQKDSSCSRPDVTNAMYCIALLLLYFRNRNYINFGLHYRVYYALYMIENSIPNHQKEKLKIVTGLPGQQSIHSYSNAPENAYTYLTYEQIRVLNHRFELNQKIRIIALAGTGKTTTLLHLTRLYPQIKFLNLVFNRAMSDHAKKKFPLNVTCQTAHSLAYKSIGKFLRHKLVKKVRPYELVSHIRHNHQNMQVYAYSNLVLSTINAFTTSVSSQLSLTHVPLKDLFTRRLSEGNRENILKDACLIWEMMINKDDKSIKITHDTYLKLYQLKKPTLHKYQCIMVDEAQDCNNAMLDIVLSQNVPVILVGDPHQQIYGFRGAKNALHTILFTHTYYLTKSFRFGPEISYIASCLLEYFKVKARSATIIGNSHDSFIDGTTKGQYAVIAKTNVKLFNEAIRMVVQNNLRPNEPAIINAAFVGGISSYGLEQIMDICKLKEIASSRERNITDKFVSRFNSFTELSNYARYAEDAELLNKIELVSQYGADIFNYVSVLKEKCNHPMELANVVFSTAHKSKGLEFDTVYITEDFSFNCPAPAAENTVPEDVNIMYVAMTRAKKCLLMPEKLAKIILNTHEKFEYPISSKLALGNKSRLTCCLCDTVFVPHTVLLMIKRRIVLASGREIVGGPLCMKCGSDPQMRLDVHLNQIVMYLDPILDNTHQFMNCITGPLPTDPPIAYDNFARFEDAEQVFVINVNIH